MGLPPHRRWALQGQACRLQGKEDAQDFSGLLKALQALGLCPEELTAIWAMLATILHLGNICFSSTEVGSPCGQGPRGALDQLWLVCIIKTAIRSQTPVGRDSRGPGFTAVLESRRSPSQGQEQRTWDPLHPGQRLFR